MASLMSKLKKDDTKSQDKETKVNDAKDKKVATKKSVVNKSVKKSDSKEFAKAYKVLVKPLVSEKGAIQQANSKYFFEVARNTNKIEVKRSIESIYGVNVVSVNIMNQRGKTVRFGRSSGSRKSWKKAIVTLKAGERITTVEGV